MFERGLPLYISRLRGRGFRSHRATQFRKTGSNTTGFNGLRKVYLRWGLITL